MIAGQANSRKATNQERDTTNEALSVADEIALEKGSACKVEVKKRIDKGSNVSTLNIRALKRRTRSKVNSWGAASIFEK